ncbi:hypothetical protein KRR40_18500 [Niabella defluvii]|nr:hypothetical protein KRR40_18500 [Niabella sp. I65]
MANVTVFLILRPHLVGTLHLTKGGCIGEDLKTSYIYTKFKTMSHLTANVSNKFKRSGQKSVFAIILFIVVYILLVIGSAILAFFCLKIGLAIIMNVGAFGEL